MPKSKVLPGIELGNVRQCGGDTTERRHAIPSPQPLRERETACPLGYRELPRSFEIFAASGILYNHESPLRGLEFVTRKITDAVARIHVGLQRSSNWATWTHAGIGDTRPNTRTPYGAPSKPNRRHLCDRHGRLTPVRKFVEAAFRAVGVEIDWKGRGDGRERMRSPDRKLRVRVSAEFFRPAEAVPLCGDARKAQKLLGWKAQTQVDDICRIMVEREVERLREGGLA